MLKASEVLAATKAVCADFEFTGVTTDSRAVKPGELFVALKGDNFDGHDYCAKAVELGAAGVVVSHEVSGLPAGVAVYTRGLIQKLLILVGLSLAYVIYAILTNGMGLGTPINFAKISEAAWFGMPQFETPVFSLSAITLIAPVVIILVGENLGHIKAVTAMTGRNLDPYMGRAFLGDGLATMFSASCGGTGVTTYGENIGVMAATRVYSTLLFPVAACFAIILGFSPKFGAVIQTIPQPILGGTSIVVFGLIAVAGARVWVVNHVNFGDNRNLIVAAVTLILGGGDFTIHLGNFTLGGIGTATFGAIILNALMEFGERRVSGTIEEEPHEANLDAQADKQ